MMPNPLAIARLFKKVKPLLDALQEQSETFQVLSEPTITEAEVKQKDGMKKVFVVTERVCFETLDDAHKYIKLTKAVGDI